jgi:hypothetical protein
MFIGGQYEPANVALTVGPRLSLMYKYLKTHL